MKKILLSLFTFALFASCDKEVPKEPTPVVPEGIETYATFRFNTGDATKTRSHEFPTDQSEKSEINYADISILIFQESGSQTLATKELAKDVTTQKKLTVRTTSGQKRIFVFNNVDNLVKAKLNALVVGTTKLDDFYKIMSDPHSENNANAAMGEEFLEIVDGTNGVADDSKGHVTMSNGASRESLFTLEPGIDIDQSATGGIDENNFSITVKRLVAKARLAVINTGVIDGVFKTKENPNLVVHIGATPGDIKYGIRNVNRSIFYVQNFGDDSRLDTDLGDESNNNDPIRPFAPYYTQYTSASIDDGFTQAHFTPFYLRSLVDLDATIGNDAAANADNYKYITENSSDNQMIGNTTYFGIEATIRVIPAKYMVKSFALADPNKILKERYYEIVADDAPFAYVVDDADHTINEGDKNPNTFYYQRRETTTGITLSSQELRVFKRQADAFQAMYINLESAGFIGTPDNNQTEKPVEGGAETRALNDGIWAPFNSDASNTIPSRYTKPTGVAASGNAVTDPTKPHALYFASYTELMDMYNTAVEGPNSATHVMGFNHPRIKVISESYAIKFPGQDLTDFFGVYVGAKCYYRLNIFQDVNDGLLNLVRRNHSYSAQVTGFKNIGEPSLENLDRNPGDGVDQRVTAVTANIKVQKWHEVVINGDI